MKKQTIISVLIILISININGQVAQKITSNTKGIAYFDSSFVYKDLQEVSRADNKTFIIKIEETLFVNDLKLIINSFEKYSFGEENCYGITYMCRDEQKNTYSLAIHFAYGHPYKACLIANNTPYRYGFSHNY